MVKHVGFFLILNSFLICTYGSFEFFKETFLHDRNSLVIDNDLMQAVTINPNAWTDAGHAVNQLYDILYMMGRDDIAVGVGGEGGILEDGTILPNVGGYLPIIEQVNLFISI